VGGNLGNGDELEQLMHDDLHEKHHDHVQHHQYPYHCPLAHPRASVRPLATQAWRSALLWLLHPRLSAWRVNVARRRAHMQWA
jgi:hypothetical protein